MLTVSVCSPSGKLPLLQTGQLFWGNCDIFVVNNFPSTVQLTVLDAADTLEDPEDEVMTIISSPSRMFDKM